LSDAGSEVRMRKNRRAKASVVEPIGEQTGTLSPEAAPEEAQASGNWLSERDFKRTLDLVDRTCQELRASEERAEQLKATSDEMLQDAEKRLEAAQEHIQQAEERAVRAEDWSRHVEDRAVRADARAIEAERRAHALEEWADSIQGAIGELRPSK
jgi:chromosome segregation ATPase